MQTTKQQEIDKLKALQTKVSPEIAKSIAEKVKHSTKPINK